MRRALVLAMVAACKAPVVPAADAGTPPSRAACIDAQLAARRLNRFGDPLDTVYAGGSPLFDEKSGAARDRLEAVISKHPELGQACPPR